MLKTFLDLPAVIRTSRKTVFTSVSLFRSTGVTWFFMMNEFRVSATSWRETGFLGLYGRTLRRIDCRMDELVVN